MGESVREEKAGSTVVYIKCFRGIRDARLELAPVTILTGRNNTGKSSVLEALALAFSAPSMHDWMGSSIARIIIDGKLAGRPVRLLNTACNGEAVIKLETDNKNMQAIRVARPDISADRELLCIILRRLQKELFDDLSTGGESYECIRGVISSYTSEGEALATIMLAVGYTIAYLAWQACGSGRRSGIGVDVRDLHHLLLPESIVRSISHLQGALNSVASRLIEHASRTVMARITSNSVIIKTEKRASLYLPGTSVSGRVRDQLYERLRTLSGVFARNMIALTGAVLEKSDLKDLYAIHVKLQLSKQLGRTVRDCIWEKLKRVVDDLWSRPMVELGLAGESGEATWRVYTVFRRGTTTLSGAPWVGTLTRILSAVHEAGLYEDYNNVVKSIKRPQLKDPIIEDGEVYLLRDGEKIPVALLGDGTLQLLVLLAGIVLARKQPRTVLIFEEPETGLHPGYLIVLADNIAKTVKENPHVFIVLSTHSEELIRFIAKRAMKQGVLDKVKAILMREGETYSVFEGAEILEAEEIGAELRGV